jgi:hypothetical protein
VVNEARLRRAHQAARIIETDGIEGYRTCTERFGADVANALLVLFLRISHNPEGRYPSPDNLREKVNAVLTKAGIYCPEREEETDAI